MIPGEIDEVLNTKSGRDVVRWLLSNIKPSTISGQMVTYNAALLDCYNRINGLLWREAPENWHKAVVEEASEMLDYMNSRRDGDDGN